MFDHQVGRIRWRKQGSQYGIQHRFRMLLDQQEKEG